MKCRMRAGEPERVAVVRTMPDFGDPALLEVQDGVLSHSRVLPRLRSARCRRGRHAVAPSNSLRPHNVPGIYLGVRRSVR